MIMRKIFSIIAITVMIFLSSCVKNRLTTWTGTVIEFDAATWNANAAGRTYPILTRVPAYGVTTSTSTSTTALTRTTAPFQLRVNLVGPQSSTDIPVAYRVVDAESTAVGGVHYSAFTGNTIIPANSSFGYITVTPLNPGATSGSKILVLELIKSTVNPSPNYSKVGLSIAQN
jgi:hypothetical protein